ncbi:flagellar protein FlaG [Planctobacterium marinum]|uniref:Flagellar protein FlaG n=1 Tax=Planctobacterium marinum TaxID=1631968 RepID=A0AA48I8A3_9ALTE|nr:hypothetical protein MACH26_33210 [Planctobacterium marinum]
MEIDLAQTGFNANLTQNTQPAVVRRSEELQAENSNESSNNNRAASRANFRDTPNVSELQADNNGIGEQASVREIENAVSEVRDFVQSQRTNLNFSFNDDSNRSIVQVTDSDTGELIRQIPSEEVLALSDRIRGLQSDVGEAVGVLFSKEV